MNQPKSFWKRPEGVTGALFLIGLIAGGAYLAAGALGAILSFLSTLLGTIVGVLVVAALLFLLIDKRSRNLIWYSYKNIMRTITGLFVQMDPVAILKSYLEDMKKNLREMSKQIGLLRGQMRKLRNTIDQNNKEIDTNMREAQRAKQQNLESQMILKARKASRLKESNAKLEALYDKMEILYKVLRKMHQSSEIVYEDTKDQVSLKEQERKAIRASHSAMKSAMNIINGNSDRRYMFDQAMEALADDVATKVGEMERFMDVSTNFMHSIDLQNGVFEEQGLKMLEEWEQKSIKILLGEEKAKMIESGQNEIDLNQELPKKNTVPRTNEINNDYSNLFD
jgi:phage shock protein A